MWDSFRKALLWYVMCALVIGGLAALGKMDEPGKDPTEEVNGMMIASVCFAFGGAYVLGNFMKGISKWGMVWSIIVALTSIPIAYFSPYISYILIGKVILINFYLVCLFYLFAAGVPMMTYIYSKVWD